MSRDHSFARLSSQLSTQLSVVLSGLMLLGMLPAGCGGDTQVTVTQLALSGPSSLAAGLSGQMTATALYSDGSSKDVTSSVTWTSDAATTLTVSDSAQNKGQVKAVAIGTAHVHAALDTQSSDATIEVSAAQLQDIAISPQSAQITQGTTLQLTATGSYSDGSTKDLTNLVNWSTGDGSLAQVSSDAGLLTAVAQGTVSISATYDGVTASLQFTVTAPTLTGLAISAAGSTLNVGDTLQLTSTGTYSDDEMLDVTTGVFWQSSDESILTVSNDVGSEGVVTAVASGTVVVTVTLGDSNATYQLTVN